MSFFYVNPAERVVALTASANTIQVPTGGIYCSTTGTINFTTVGGSVVTGYPVLEGSYHPIQIVILSAGTGVYGLYHK